MRSIIRSLRPAVLAAAVCILPYLLGAQDTEPWAAQKANAWYDTKPWLVGCNFTPASAINQLEMWQAETFDPEQIDRELQWAQDLGFTSIRVFLHDIPWAQDRDGFIARIEKFLEIADKHHIGVMFVLFDGVWHPYPKPGKQPEPKPGLHNSGWVQNPGADILKDPARHDAMEKYVKDIVGHFRDDKRVHVWDLFNEPDNMNTAAYGDIELPDKAELAAALLAKSFKWAREVQPSQPLTSGVWLGDWSDPDKLTPMQNLQLDESDIITFHTYGSPDDAKKRVEELKRYNRPILCTEYMARPIGSTFDPILGYFKSVRVGAYNWGFVSGKSQTIFPWDSWQKPYEGEPPVWFHDIFRPDGTPYREEEVQYIRGVTGKSPETQPATQPAAPTTRPKVSRGSTPTEP